MIDDGLFTISCHYPVAETMQRLVAAVTERNMLVFGRIDHSEGAARAGMSLRPTVLLNFGHPKGGTPLMQERQTAGIDLPLKALAWEDADGKRPGSRSTAHRGLRSGTDWMRTARR